MSEQVNAFIRDKIKNGRESWTIYALWADGSQDQDEITADNEAKVEAEIGRIAGVPFSSLDRWDAHHDDGQVGGFTPPLSGKDSNGNKFYAFPSCQVAAWGEWLDEEINDEFPNISYEEKERILGLIADNVH